MQPRRGRRHIFVSQRRGDKERAKIVAQQRGEVQKALLEEFTADAASIEDVDIDAALAAAARRLAPVDSIRNDLSVHRS